MKKFILAAILPCLFEACSNDVIIGDSDELINKSELSLDTNDSILSFASKADFDQVVSALKKMDCNTQQEWLNENYGNFHSLSDEFEEALLEAEKLDESEEAFKTYYSKYGETLFFPFFRDGVGPYLPVIDKYVAKLLNKKGKVLISGVEVDLKDIHNYSQLQELHRAMYSLNETQNKVGRKRVAGTPAGDEYDSEWYHENGKKIRLKCQRRYTGEYEDGQLGKNHQYGLHIEISFRKKTWLGWTNYVSFVGIDARFNLADGQLVTLLDSHTNDSSHDYYIDLPKVYKRPFSMTDNYSYIAPGIDADVKLDYRGIGHTLQYNFTLDPFYEE